LGGKNSKLIAGIASFLECVAGILYFHRDEAIDGVCRWSGLAVKQKKGRIAAALRRHQARIAQ
jgi:hypothetical protein